jgi:hypothetical protein
MKRGDGTDQQRGNGGRHVDAHYRRLGQCRPEGVAGMATG